VRPREIVLDLDDGIQLKARNTNRFRYFNQWNVITQLQRGIHPSWREALTTPCPSQPTLEKRKEVN